jgi:hypothetical protein
MRVLRIVVLFGMLLLLLALAVNLTSASPGLQEPEPEAAGTEPSFPPEAEPVQYSVKFVCGLVPFTGDHQAPLNPGNYATAVNIHNYTAATVSGSYRIALHYRDGDPTPPIIGTKNINPKKFRTLEIDCVNIWSKVGLPPGTFVKGMLHIGLAQNLPIAAVYTAQTNLSDPVMPVPPDAGAGISIDVENISPFLDLGGT